MYMVYYIKYPVIIRGATLAAVKASCRCIDAALTALKFPQQLFQLGNACSGRGTRASAQVRQRGQVGQVVGLVAN